MPRAIYIVIFFIFAASACSGGRSPSEIARNIVYSESETNLVIAQTFAYPISEKHFLTQARDSKDDWYNALDFGEQNHLGEDWNKNSGGNTDCGEPVYAIGDGLITYAADAGPKWGNVIIITHKLPDGSRVQSLYAHLNEMIRTEGEVKLREKIGTVGNANGAYLCHLHFEIREEHCPMWDKVGSGYSSVRDGWIDPSDFIDKHR